MHSYAAKCVVLLCFILNNGAFTIGQLKLDLGGDVWRVQNIIKDYDFPATVPGGIYTDLMKNKVIGDVFFGFNDVGTRWVSKLDWTYSRSFTIDISFYQQENINLVFEGVDTFAKIFINGMELPVSTENMFVRYIFNVKSYLRNGENKIEVQFSSAVNKANRLYEQQAKDYVVVPVCLPAEYNGECHANHVRKMQASFAWDWGPALPSVGIWKDVYLEAYKSTVLRDITVNTIPNSDTKNWDVEFSIYLADNSRGTATGDFSVRITTDDGDVIANRNDVTIIKNSGGDLLEKLRISVPQEKVQLWWPNGYGEAKLYEAKVQFTTTGESDSRTLKIGFRTVKLVESEIDKGRTFYFKINGEAIFAKGSNSIPISILPELANNEDTIRFLLQSAKDVHMNMLRVWGGGNYEADIFYQLADEMGILIWQDFMFACAMYPTTNDYLSTVTSEVKHQVRRLQHHPSIILWAGNNENEAALRQNWYGTEGNNFKQYYQDYVKLYVDTIQTELLKNDVTRPYLTSSPTNGLQSIEEGYVADDPQSHFYGDVHFYNYENDSWISGIYPINRFASEYGYQALPSVNTLLTATDDVEDLKIGSFFLEHRQHLPDGFSKMKKLIDYRLLLPNEDDESYHEAYVYFSQIIQAMAVKIQTEFYRHWRSYTNRDGRGQTMGALYWQLNDVWVAPTWSGIDFKNNWKMLHYFAKDFFAPVIVTSDSGSNETVDVYVVSDLIQMIPKVTITINVYNWNSLAPVHSEIIKIAVYPSASKKIWTATIEDFLSQISGGPCGDEATKNCFLHFTAIDEQNKTIAPDNYWFPIPLKSATYQKPTISIQNIEKVTSNNEYTLTIGTDVVALFVWLEAKGIPGRFSENGFLLVRPTKVIQFYPEKATTVAELTKALTVSDLKKFGGNGAQTIVSGIRNAISIVMVILIILVVN